MSKRRDRERLAIWQERLAKSDAAYASETARMDVREALYGGTKEIRPVVEGEVKSKTPHVRNICAELIEAQVGTGIPQPKVTARREGDETKAKLIEDMIRNELDRMPFEQINDMMQRTVPIQGGAAFLIEWDNTERTHFSVGEIVVTPLHPKQILPQDGVYTGIEDMDYIILKLPQTKGYIRRRYGVDVDEESESEPEIKSAEAASAAEDMVTQYIAYYRGENGGIGLYSWVGDTVLEDLDDYQARRLRRCGKCGAVEPLEAVVSVAQTEGGVPPAGDDAAMNGDGSAGGRGRRAACPYCGAHAWEESVEDTEELYFPIRRSDGSVIPGAHMEIHETGEVDMFGMPITEVVGVPTKIPFYKPDIYPVILQKNVSVYGRFLGDSDIDKIEDQQNTINRIEAKIIDKLVKSGSYISLPNDVKIRRDAEDMKVIYLSSPADKAMIDVYNMQAEIGQDMAYLAQIYEESRQGIGITDSFQGRIDRTATSGKAKEFAAAQSAGRLESKRVMQDAAYSALFEAMFKFRLAYADEPRPVVSNDIHGNARYDAFNRYDFLEQDEAGEWCWNDQFLFSCDTTAPLAANREAMWQETRMNLQSGAFGDPSDPETLILFWTKMELLHYPGAGETKAYLEERLKRQAAQAQMSGPISGDTTMAQQGIDPAMAQQGIDPAMVQQVIERARADAQAAAQSGVMT